MSIGLMFALTQFALIRASAASLVLPPHDGVEDHKNFLPLSEWQFA